MSNLMKVVIVVALIASIGIVAALKQSGKNASSALSASPAAGQAEAVLEPTPTPEALPTATATALPKLLDLGAGKCIPCKMMKPILDELATEYKDRFQTVFIDVWENPDEAKAYKINLIPTQLFFDAAGQELFRHEGFFSKEDILGKWKELGVDLGDIPSVPEFIRLRQAD
jgi:thioredoxin 1